MNDGTAYRYPEDICWRSYTIRVQKKSYKRMCWPWWTHSQYSHLLFRRQRNQNSLLENIPLPDSLERGLFEGGLTRREYKVRLLEARYSRALWRDAAKFEEHPQCGYKDVCGQPAGSLFGDQSPETGARAGEKAVAGSAKIVQGDRRSSDDTISHRVFQSVGSDLIAPWLTPHELKNMEMAMDISWDWARVWHHGKVKSRAVASRVEYDLYKRTMNQLIEMYDRDELFSALWYLTPPEIFVKLAHEYLHYPSIRKICTLSR